jgi:RNA polymerase sigma-70 factor (ECF subfamily)
MSAERAAELEQHRTALTGHCYRMLGSAVDADDAVQETMVRAWRALPRFDGRSSLRTWLYRIATNVCLDALTDKARRERPFDVRAEGTIHDPLDELPRTHWLEPVPDARVLPADADPAERAMLKQSVRLAFVAALQYLPPKQRAALLLADVLGMSAAEIAETLDASVPSINSALQRARATLVEREAGKQPAASRSALDDAQTALVERYVAAFERYDMAALTALLHEDATMSMPPYTLWLRGHDAISGWMLGRGSACRGSRLVPVEASGAPAFGQYKPGDDGKLYPWALVVLEPAGDKLSSMTFFLDTATYFPMFGLPPFLDR